MKPKQKVFLIIAVLLFLGTIDNVYLGVRNRYHLNENHNDEEKASYWSGIKQNESFIRLYGDSDEIKYELINIDDDSIPEMVIADDDTHSSTVSIFKYNVENGQIYYVNSIGSNAGIWYLEKKNKIFAEYGNQGVFTEVSYSIVNNDMVCNAAVMKDNNTDSFFTGIETSTNLENENLTYYTLADFNLQKVSKSAYDNGFSDKEDALYISYNSMKNLD